MILTFPHHTGLLHGAGHFEFLQERMESTGAVQVLVMMNLPDEVVFGRRSNHSRTLFASILDPLRGTHDACCSAGLSVVVVRLWLVDWMTG